MDIIFERQVTPAEAKKGHITIRARYHGLFESQFEPIRHEDDVKCPEKDFLKEFIRESDHQLIELKLCRRNEPRREMRLYFNDKDGVKARRHQIVTIHFTPKGAVIGVRDGGMIKPETIFPEEGTIPKLQRPLDTEEKLNRALWTDPRYHTVAEKKVLVRSGALAERCLKNAKYECEAGRDSDHFLSKRTKKPYVEVHHLIPLKEQKRFTASLDCLENLCCLSPLAHKAIHYGTDSEVAQIIEQLLITKRSALLMFGINEDALYKMYGTE
jgi:hypothetical protein